MLARRILEFYRQLELRTKLPRGVSFMNPYQDEQAFDICSQFYNRFYNDTNKRTIILGINPGRFGGGITGVPFTDPIKLQERCGIINPFPKKPELSADFIYAMIDVFGGPEKFYSSFLISALSPLGFVKDGKNLNYYDIPQLQQAVEPFMIDCIRKQLDFGIEQRVAFCLGEGTNFKYLQKLNSKFDFFQRIEPLPHPRFVMQYKRKHVKEYVDRYVEALKG
jgi:hypothetical protein